MRFVWVLAGRRDSPEIIKEGNGFEQYQLSCR